MYKENFTFTFSDCVMDATNETVAYCKKLEEVINGYLAKAENVIFFHTNVESDKLITAKVGLKPVDNDGENLGFAIELYVGGAKLTSSIFEQDCVICLTMQYNNLLFRHLFRDGEYLQAIKF